MEEDEQVEVRYSKHPHPNRWMSRSCGWRSMARVVAVMPWDERMVAERLGVRLWLRLLLPLSRLPPLLIPPPPPPLLQSAHALISRSAHLASPP